MTESSSPGSSDSGPDEDQLVPDEKLPEDLQPDKNPLARDPDDEDTSDAGPRPGADSDAPGAAGMPDMGQPGQPG